MLLKLQDGIVALGYYYPYKRHGNVNPDHDDHSRMILSLKDLRYGVSQTFADMIRRHFEIRNIAIFTVPSSDPSKLFNGIHRVSEKLKSDIDNVIYMSGSLKRITRIDAAHLGGTRNVQVHLNTIQLALTEEDRKAIANKLILVLDDVYTTGSSMQACMRILSREFPDSLILGLCIGRTKDYTGRNNPEALRVEYPTSAATLAVHCKDVEPPSKDGQDGSNAAQVNTVDCSDESESNEPRDRFPVDDVDGLFGSKDDDSYDPENSPY